MRSRLAGVIRCRLTRTANTIEDPMMNSSPATRNLRRSTISLSAPAGIASRNIGRLVATCTMATMKGLESRLVMSHPEAAEDIHPPMFETTVAIQMTVKVLWRNGPQGDDAGR